MPSPFDIAWTILKDDFAEMQADPNVAPQMAAQGQSNLMNRQMLGAGMAGALPQEDIDRYQMEAIADEIARRNLQQAVSPNAPRVKVTQPYGAQQREYAEAGYPEMAPGPTFQGE